MKKHRTGPLSLAGVCAFVIAATFMVAAGPAFAVGEQADALGDKTMAIAERLGKGATDECDLLPVDADAQRHQQGGAGEEPGDPPGAGAAVAHPPLPDDAVAVAGPGGQLAQ